MAVDTTADRRLPIEAYHAHGRSVGLQWTELRKRLLALIWSAEEPLGAYEAAERLSAPGRPAYPTSVYRLLQRFEQAGLVLPIVTWNRYVLSPNPTIDLWGLLLCRTCRSCTAVDLTGEQVALDCRLKARKFTAARCSVECEGQCRFCKAAKLNDGADTR